VSFAIAAVGTGGHVFPGLAVGEALVSAGVDRSDVLCVGGDRMEATVFPAAGFPFLGLELVGLTRSLTVSNLRIPVVVARAVRSMRRAFKDRAVDVVLGMGGYVTVPAAAAGRLAGATVMVSEQNAHAGLGNRAAGMLAARRFGAFPVTQGMDAEWVGNPIRSELVDFRREELRTAARQRYGLRSDRPVVGIFGGSLGAGVLNDVAAGIAAIEGVQLVHLAGERNIEEIRHRAPSWTVVGFEEHMEYFYAATDLVVARAGGAVAELTATGTPSVLVPGGFGSAGHQDANAAALEAEGAAIVVPQALADTIPRVVSDLVGDAARMATMRAAAVRMARPEAATVIAAAMIAAHG